MIKLMIVTIPDSIAITVSNEGGVFLRRLFFGFLMAVHLHV
jgi:hypothetical protein